MGNRRYRYRKDVPYSIASSARQAYQRALDKIRLAKKRLVIYEVHRINKPDFSKCKYPGTAERAFNVRIESKIKRERKILEHYESVLDEYRIRLWNLLK